MLKSTWERGVARESNDELKLGEDKQAPGPEVGEIEVVGREGGGGLAGGRSPGSSLLPGGHSGPLGRSLCSITEADRFREALNLASVRWRFPMLLCC